MMRFLSGTNRVTLVGFVFLFTLAGPGSAMAEKLFTISTENGLEFYSLDTTIETTSPEAILASQSRSRLSLEDNPAYSDWGLESNSLLPLEMSQPDHQVGLFRGFRTSFHGRVLEIDAHVGAEQWAVAPSSSQELLSMELPFLSGRLSEEEG